MTTELPEGWSAAKLSDLIGHDGLFCDGDWVESKDQDPTGDVRLIQLADIGDGFFRNRSSRFLTYQKAVALNCTFLEPGDILVARMPEPIGRACVFPGDRKKAVTVVDVCVIRPATESLNPRWVQHAVNSPQFRTSLEEHVRGTTRKRISRLNLAGLDVAIPPLSEQRRIVEKIDELLARVEAARGRLIGAVRLLDQVRKSIVAAACSGSLAEMPVPAGVTKEERAWTTKRLGDIFAIATGATPLRKNFAYYKNGDVPWIKSGAVNRQFITEADEFITQLALKETNAKTFPPGTLLVAMYGEGATRGKVAELGIAAATNQALAAILFSKETESMRPFLKLILRNRYNQSREDSAGGVQPNLSLQMIRDIEITLPSSAEQSEIISRVEALTALSDVTETRIRKALSSTDKLNQAILAKAFAGELVPTEAELARREGRDYEPASVLLGRIRQERPVATKSSRSSRTRRRELKVRRHM